MGSEEVADPIERAERRRLENASQDEVANLYWAMRKVARRLRIAKGKGGPRRRFKGGKFRRKIRRFAGKFAKIRRGFFVGAIWVVLGRSAR